MPKKNERALNEDCLSRGVWLHSLPKSVINSDPGQRRYRKFLSRYTSVKLSLHSSVMDEIGKKKEAFFFVNIRSSGLFIFLRVGRYQSV